MGLRDYAVLMALAKLGLRASEVAALSLDDIDWQSGSVLVHGKGRRQAMMPLRHDVGAAIVAYIRHGRPASPCRRLFLRMLAPHVGFASGCAILVAPITLSPSRAADCCTNTCTGCSGSCRDRSVCGSGGSAMVRGFTIFVAVSPSRP